MFKKFQDGEVQEFRSFFSRFGDCVKDVLGSSLEVLFLFLNELLVS